MRKSQGRALPEGIKVLTEEEIRNRLYGEYLKPAAPPSGSEWTGAEILSEELKRLRSELISLRREREDLESLLKQREDARPKFSAVGVPREGVNLLGMLVGVIVFVAGVMGPLSVKFLQASPQVVGEVSPYTIQVAVYDLRPMAHQAVGRLNQMGYPAFLVDSSRANGRPRYKIYMGSFVTKEEADQERRRLTADPEFTTFSDAFVKIKN